MTQELYKKHRPKDLKSIIGQPEAVKMLREWISSKRVPHAITLTGSSGCGKTTIARILKESLECKNQDFIEMNCADTRGIDTIREIRKRMGLAPIGKCRIWLLDECGNLSKDAQTALLKMLEDTPKHVYFLLATTDPQKLLPTIRTRCTELRMQPLSPKSMVTLLQSVAEKEGKKFSEEVLERIVEVAEGSARKALVVLDSILGLEDEDEQLNAVMRNEFKTESFAIAKALMNPRCTWQEMQKILNGCEISEPESIRYMVLGYCTAILLKSSAPRAAMIIDCFSGHFYDSKKAGLVLACYQVVTGK